MTSRNVTNNHIAALQIGGVTIPAGATAAVPNWEVHGDAASIKTWIELEVISVAKGKVADPPAGLPGVTAPGLPGVDMDTRTDEEKEKDALIAQLVKIGGPQRTRASSVESLQKQIARQTEVNAA